VAALVALLRDRAAVAPPGLLVPIRPAGDRPPLFLVHPGGGGVLCYAGLARALGPDQPCYALRASGLEAGEPRLRTVEGMAQRYLEEVRAVRPHGPYVLAGWSTGGMVAYEMARRDGDAALVALLDTAASLPAWDESAGPALYEQLGLAGGSYEVFRSNLIASARYAPAGAARCPAVVLRAAESTTPVEGWERLGAETLAVPGDHLTMLQAPHVTVLAGRLAARIDAVRSGPPLSRIAEDR
jgi:thioesterase domain-containing protein